MINAENIIKNMYNRGIKLSVSNGELLVDAPKGEMSEIDIENIRENKKSILLALDKANNAIVYSDSYQSKSVPLSSAQENMLIMDSISKDIPYSNNVYTFNIEGPVNLKILSTSINQLVFQNEILRTIYSATGESPSQIIKDEHSAGIIVEDVCNEVDKEASKNALLRREANYVFDLMSELPVRCCLLKLHENQYVLCFNFHQIACDGLSAISFFKQLSELYNASIRGTQQFTGTNKYQYRDFVFWQKGFQNSLAYSLSCEYWSKSLQGAPELHGLPTDFIRPSNQLFRGGIYESSLDESTKSKLDNFSTKNNTTMFVVLQAVLACMVAKYSDETDIVIGTAASNRNLSEFVDMIGCFVNTLPFRYQLDMEKSFTQCLAQVKDVINEGLKHQQVSFDKIVNDINPKRSFSYNPLVQVMLVVQNDQASDLHFDECKVSPIVNLPEISRFDLTLHVFIKDTTLEFRWEYNADLFKRLSIERYALHFNNLLSNFIDNPELSLSKISFYTDQEEAINKPKKTLPHPLMIHQAFEEQCEKSPKQLAVADGAGGLNYREVDEGANKIANFIRAQLPCASGNTFVGIFLKKSTELVLGMLGVFKANAIYVPFDPAYPKNRIRFMLEDSGVSLVLIDDSIDSSIFDGLAVQLFNIKDILKNEENSSRPAIKNNKESAHRPAYVIYTSGSTGKPKGVVVPHSSLYQSLISNSQLMGICNSDLMPCIGSQAFGISLLEMLLPLTNGACVQMISHENVKDLDTLIDITGKATVLHAVPSLMEKWLERSKERNVNYDDLRLLLIGGEPVPDELLNKIQKWRPDISLIELYGMTEVSVVCSAYRVGTEYAANYCIGTPYDSSEFYVLNKHLQPQPKGVPGELYIGGSCLANGYLNLPEITEEKFIESTINGVGRLYKTGDRVRLLDDQSYEFLGRTDNQVNLRGVRIECGEIEYLLMQHKEIKKAVSHVMTLSNGDPVLVAYLQTQNENIDTENLLKEARRIMEENLPDYMRPGIYQFVDVYPLNPNGKIDRKSLPVPKLEHKLDPPRTDTEKQMLQLWLESFDTDCIGVESDFFEIGGNSLLAAKIINKSKDRFSIPLPLTTIFESPTIRRLAKAVDEKLQENIVSSLVYESTSEELTEDELII